MKLNDLTGQRFSHLLVIRRASGVEARYYVRWLCKCDCGTEKFVARSSLLNGDTRSCGCLQAQEASRRRATHGLSRTVEYMSWKNMRSRCGDPRNKAYHNYGGRGISVDSRWSSFEAFLEDMGTRPIGTTLERKDNNKGYSKVNCEWACRSVQQSNTRRTVLITAFGKTQSRSAWAEEVGINHTTLAYRLLKGMTPEKALTCSLKCGLPLSERN